MYLFYYIVSRLKLTCEFVVCDKLAIFQEIRKRFDQNRMILYINQLTGT